VVLLASKLRAALSTSGDWGIGTASYRVAAHRATQIIVIVILVPASVEVSEFPVAVSHELVLRKWLRRVIIIVIKHVIAPV
jgi:hypothetical protein